MGQVTIYLGDDTEAKARAAASKGVSLSKWVAGAHTAGRYVFGAPRSVGRTRSETTRVIAGKLRVAGFSPR